MSPSKRKKLTMGVLLGLAVASTVGALAAIVNLPVEQKELKVDSFDNKHLRAKWEIDMKAVRKGDIVNASVSQIVQSMTAPAGKYTGNGEVLKNEQRSDPTCTGTCFYSYAIVEATSRPGYVSGQQYPLINWVYWYFYPYMKEGGTAEVEFEVKLPGFYAEWTLTTTHYTIEYHPSAWGYNTYATRMAPKVNTINVHS